MGRHIKDLGKEEKRCGNKAKRGKGKESAKTKPRRPIVNWSAPKWEDSEKNKKEPMILVIENSILAHKYKYILEVFSILAKNLAKGQKISKVRYLIRSFSGTL